VGHETRDIPFINKDCRELNYFPYHIVIHLAARTNVRKSWDNLNQFHTDNILLTKYIYETYRWSKILYASSQTAKEVTTPYAMTKKVCELMAPSNAIGLRFSTIYGGEHARPDMLYRTAKEGRLKYITSHERDFIHVEDVCSAIETIMNKTSADMSDKGKGPVYDVAMGRNI